MSTEYVDYESLNYLNEINDKFNGSTYFIIFFILMNSKDS